MSEVVKTLRRSGLTELTTALAIAEKFTRKRQFPFQTLGHAKRPFPTNPLAIPPKPNQPTTPTLPDNK